MPFMKTVLKSKNKEITIFKILVNIVTYLIFLEEIIGFGVELKPKGVLPVALSMPVTFTCIKMRPGTLFGWSVNFSNGGQIIINSSLMTHNINFTVTLMGNNITILEFEPDKIIGAISCQLLDKHTGAVVHSTTATILIVGKIFLSSLFYNIFQDFWS